MEDDRGPSFPARSLGGSVFGASQSIPWLHSASLHDIETRADCIYTVSNSLVNPQTPEVVTNLVEDYLYKEFEKLHSRNTIKVIPGFGGLPWVGDINHWNFQAAYEATKVRRRRMYILGAPPGSQIQLLQSVYGNGLAPYYTLEGGTIPLVFTLQNELQGKPNVLLLPMGRSDDGAQ